MKSVLRFPLYLLVLTALAQAVPTLRAAGPVPLEEQRKSELRNRLCKQKDLSCKYVDSVFADPRLKLYEPPKPTAPPPSAAPRERERNPYLTNRFGLLTAESLERCRSVIEEHAMCHRTDDVRTVFVLAVFGIDQSLSGARRSGANARSRDLESRDPRIPHVCFQTPFTIGT